MLESFLFSVDAGGTSKSKRWNKKKIKRFTGFDSFGTIPFQKNTTTRLHQTGKTCRKRRKKHMATALIGGRGGRGWRQTLKNISLIYEFAV